MGLSGYKLIVVLYGCGKSFNLSCLDQFSAFYLMSWMRKVHLDFAGIEPTSFVCQAGQATTLSFTLWPPGHTAPK